MEYTREAVIQAPADRIWALLTDVENWPDWTDSMKQIDRLDTGPLRVGSTARVRQPAGRPMVWTVTELVPDSNFTWTASQPGMTMTAGHRLYDSTADDTAGDAPGSAASAAQRTVLTFELTGPLAGLGAMLAGKRIRSYVDMELAGLRRAAEK
jgi:uncharacterized membrane protein